MNQLVPPATPRISHTQGVKETSHVSVHVLPCDSINFRFKTKQTRNLPTVLAAGTVVAFGKERGTKGPRRGWTTGYRLCSLLKDLSCTPFVAFCSFLFACVPSIEKVTGQGGGWGKEECKDNTGAKG